MTAEEEAVVRVGWEKPRPTPVDDIDGELRSQFLFRFMLKEIARLTGESPGQVKQRMRQQLAQER